jgi:DNA-binding transcriptional ArsR family regulator
MVRSTTATKHQKDQGTDADGVLTVKDPETLQALSHPTRIAVLEALREPSSAAAAARAIGQPRQRINYHLKELEAAGLVERVGERRSGNFVETLYRSVARAFVVSPSVVWSNPRRMETLRRQHALETLVVLGERLQHDAAALLDRATFDGDEIASAAVTAEAKFAGEEERAAFMNEYLKATAELLEKYGTKQGEGYRVVLAVYPQGGQS